MTNNDRNNKPMSMADLARQRGIEAQPQQEVETSYTCEYCQDVGMIKADNPNLRVHGRLVPCPECERGAANMRDILARKFRQTQMPEHYAVARLADWFNNLTSDERKGKYLAYYFTQSFVASSGWASTHDAIHKLENANIFRQLPDFLTAQLAQPDKARFGLVLQGSVGIGKTWLMAAALNALRDSHHVIFARSGDVLEEAVSTWGTSDKQSDALAPYRQAEILFLDDVHIDTTTKMATHYREIMTTLIRHRYDHKLPTMITCNADKETFYEDWGKRLADAVLDMCHWIPMGGDKLRDTEQNWKAI
jgi:DNA replication protein DnaC